MSIHKNGQPWGYSVTYRDGRSLLVGPYRNYAAAVAAMPGGALVLQSRAVPLKGVGGPTRILRQQQRPMTPPVAETPPPVAEQSITLGAGDLVTIFDPNADFTNAYAVVAHVSYPIEIYAPDMVIVDANTITVPWYPGGAVNNDYNGFIGGFEVFPYDGVSWMDFPNRLGLYDLTDSEIDATDGTTAKVRKVSSPAANRLQLDGVRFLSDSLGNLSKFQTSGTGNPGRVYGDPNGPHAADTSAGATIISWTDTQVIIEDAALSGIQIGITDFEDYQQPGNFGLQLIRDNNNTLINLANFPGVTP